MTLYNICFWIWLVTGTTAIFMLFTEKSITHKKRLQWLSYNKLIAHHKRVGFAYGFLIASAIFAFAGLFIFTPDPIISYIQSVQP